MHCCCCCCYCCCWLIGLRSRAVRMPFLNNVCHLPSPGNLSPGSTLRCVLLILWLQQPLPEKKEGKKKKKKKEYDMCKRKLGYRPAISRQRDLQPDALKACMYACCCWLIQQSNPPPPPQSIYTLLYMLCISKQTILYNTDILYASNISQFYQWLPGTNGLWAPLASQVPPLTCGIP